jgi:glycosyltransferase involved in cell wall biosynthesis
MSSKPPKSPHPHPNGLVIIPAWNEAGTIFDIVRSVKEKISIDILVVDDGSSDDTGDLAKSAGAAIVRLPMNIGAWTATQTGFRYALAHGYRMAVTMDADGQHLAESIPALLDVLISGAADVVIGSNPGRASTNRRMSWSFFRWLTGFDIEDFTSGFKAYNQKAMRLLLQRRAYLFDYQDLGTLLLLRRFGVRISEIPVPMQKRRHGHSRIFSTWWQVFRYMMVSTVLCVSKYRHY